MNSNPKTPALEDRIDALERAGDALAHIADMVADPAEWEDMTALRRELRARVDGWRVARHPGRR